MPTVRTLVNEDGTLRIVKWAERNFHDGWSQGFEGGEFLSVDSAPRPVQLAHSPATGQALVSNGWMGADLIRLEAGKGFVPHTHPGDHLLIVVFGEGTITYGGKIYPTEAGQMYMIEGSIPHAVGAITDHVIVAVGAPHRGVGDPERMTVVAYQEVAAEIGELHCLVCNKMARVPLRLHEIGCSHCPCPDCMS